MGVFVALVVFIFLFRILFLDQSFGSHTRKAYCFVIGFSLFLIAALRHYTVGTDVLRYVDSFYLIKNTHWVDLVFTKDPVYGYFVKLISCLTSNHQVYLAIIGAIFAISVSIFIYRYSNEPSFSFFALLSFGYFNFSMTGLRQTVALSILLFAYRFVKEKKPIKFFVVVVIASLFHVTALVFLLVYLIAYREINYRYLFTVTICIFFIYVFRFELIQFAIDNVLTDRQYSIQPSDGGITTLVTYVIIFVCGLVFKRRVIRNDDSANILYNVLILGIVFQMLVPINPNIFRLSMYFNVYNIIFIPKVLDSIEDHLLRINGYLIVLLLLGVQYFVFTLKGAGVYPYRFFWM